MKKSLPTLESLKIDRFYMILAIVLILMTTLFVFSIKGSLSVFLSAYEFDSGALAENVRVDKVKLTEAYNFAFNKEVIKLEVK